MRSAHVAGGRRVEQVDDVAGDRSMPAARRAAAPTASRRSALASAATTGAPAAASRPGRPGRRVTAAPATATTAPSRASHRASSSLAASRTCSCGGLAESAVMPLVEAITSRSFLRSAS